MEVGVMKEIFKKIAGALTPTKRKIVVADVNKYKVIRAKDY